GLRDRGRGPRGRPVRRGRDLRLVIVVVKLGRRHLRRHGALGRGRRFRRLRRLVVLARRGTRRGGGRGLGGLGGARPSDIEYRVLADQEVQPSRQEEHGQQDRGGPRHAEELPGQRQQRGL